MKIRKIFLFIVLSTFLLPLKGICESRYIEGFTQSKVDEFPKGWRSRPGQGSATKEVYKVKSEGDNKYLEADDKNNRSVQIFKIASWDIEKYPIFKWKWRAKKLPKGANETISSKNDSACGIYVSFGMLRGNALKYTWSTSAPDGTYYKKNDKMYIIVKQSGNASVGNWVFEKTNILEDAIRVFGKVPDRTLSGVAILTDGNATGSSTACDYDSIGYATVD